MRKGTELAQVAEQGMNSDVSDSKAKALGTYRSKLSSGFPTNREESPSLCLGSKVLTTSPCTLDASPTLSPTAQTHWPAGYYLDLQSISNHGPVHFLLLLFLETHYLWIDLLPPATRVLLKCYF